MDSFSENLQYITKNVESQFELRLQEFDNSYNENISWLENVSKECKSAFESTIERIFLAEKKTKAKQTRELFTPLKEFNYSAPDRVALSRQLATPASVYRPRTRAAVKQIQQEEATAAANKENQTPVENKIPEEKIVAQVKKPIETKKGKSKVQEAVAKMEEKIIEERFGKKKVEEKPVEKPVDQPEKEEVAEESEEKKTEDDASEKEEEKPQGRAGRLKAARTTAAAKKAAAAAKRAATLAEKKARAAREAEEQERAEKEEQERQAKLEREQKEERERLAAEEKEKKRLAKLEKEEKARLAKLEKEKADQEEKERLERERAEREEKEREAKAKKAAEESENESEEEAPAPKKKGRTKKTYVKKTTARGRKRARAAESEDESEAQSASEEVPKPKAKKAKLSNEKSDAEHVVEDVKMEDAKEDKPAAKEEEVKKDEEEEVIVDVVGSATPAKRVALPTPVIVEDAVMAELPLEFEESVEIITTKTPIKPKVAPRISTDSQDEVDVVIKPKTADFVVHEEPEPSSTVVASVVEPLNAESAQSSELITEKENAMQIDTGADSQSDASSQGPSTLTDSSEEVSNKAEKKQKKVGFAASQQPKPALATNNSSKALDVNDKLKRAADNRQMLEQKKREEMEKKRAQAVSKVEAAKKAREDSVKKTETASSIAAKKTEAEETREEEPKKVETTQDAAKEEDAQTRRKRWLVQSLEEKKHQTSSREAVEAAPKPQGPTPAPQSEKQTLLSFLKKPTLLTSEAALTTQSTSVDLGDSESSSSSEKDTLSMKNVDLKSASSTIPKPSGIPKPQSSFSDLRKFIRDGSDEHSAPAPKPAVVASTPAIAPPAPIVESKPLPSASNFGFKPISRENSSNNVSAPSSVKSTTSTTSTSGPTSLAPPSLTSVQSQLRDAQMMPPPQSPSSIRATSVKPFIPIKLAQSPKASPHSPQPVLSPKPSASMLYSPSPPRSPLRPRGFGWMDSPECQCPILDYCSDDESDSDIDLPVPAWTQKENLYKALEMQTSIDPDEIFGKETGRNIDLNAIFGTNSRRPTYKK